MDRKPDIVFNSQKHSDQTLFQLASGYISQTSILFENEQITAVIQAKGTVEFYDLEGTLLAAGEVPPVKNGKEVYESIRCQVADGRISLLFPIYTWIDNYPHCDGEHDRWDTKITGYHTLALDLSAQAASEHRPTDTK